MAKYIELDALVSEIERLRGAQPLDAFQPKEQNKIDWLTGKLFTINSLDVFLDTLEVKEVDLDAYTKVSKALSVAFMQFLDNIRPEGKMCLSNAECFDIEKAFAMMDYSKLLRYLEKYSKIKAQKGE